MAQVADAVKLGFEGDFCVASTYPAGTLPTDATSPLPSDFLEVGYISEDGVTVSHEDSTTDIKAWQRGDVVRTIMSEQKITLQAAIIETNTLAVETYFGSAVVNGNSLEETAYTPQRKSAVLTVIDGLYVHRMVMPSIELSERGDLVFKTEEAVAYDCTFTVYPDDQSVKIYHYWSEALLAATAPKAPPTNPFAARKKVAE